MLPFFSALILTSLLNVDGLDWHNVKSYGAPLLHGKAQFSTGQESYKYFQRLPAVARNTTRKAIWELQQNSAGLFVQFSTNSSTLMVNYTLAENFRGMWHFPPTGMSGMDAYSYDEGNSTWRWVGTTFAEVGAHVVTSKITPDLRCVGSCPVRLFRIHLPTYNTVGDSNSNSELPNPPYI